MPDLSEPDWPNIPAYVMMLAVQSALMIFGQPNVKENLIKLFVTEFKMLLAEATTLAEFTIAFYSAVQQCKVPTPSTSTGDNGDRPPVKLGHRLSDAQNEVSSAPPGE
jgi:hypothetical protein